MEGNCFLHTWDALRHQRSSTSVYRSSRCIADRLSLMQHHRALADRDNLDPESTATDIRFFGRDTEWLPCYWWRYVAAMERKHIRVWVRDNALWRCILMADPGASPQDDAVVREHPEKSPPDPLPLCDAWHIAYDNEVHFEPLLPSSSPRPPLLTTWLSGASKQHTAASAHTPSLVGAKRRRSPPDTTNSERSKRRIQPPLPLPPPLVKA